MSSSSREMAEAVEALRALDAAVVRFEAAADGPRPVVLACYGGMRHRPDPTLLLALLLRRYGVPVLIHGPGDVIAGAGDNADDASRTQARSTPGTAALPRSRMQEVLLELGIEPARGLADARRLFAQHRIACVPIAVLAPGLTALPGHRARLGGPSFADALVALIDPFHGDGYRVVGVMTPERASRMRTLLTATRARAMLLSARDEPGAGPHDCVRIEIFVDGVGTVWGEKGAPETEPCDPDDGTALASVGDATAAAAWIAQVLAGSKPVPAPVIAQLACCLQETRRPFP